MTLLSLMGFYLRPFWQTWYKITSIPSKKKKKSKKSSMSQRKLGEVQSLELLTLHNSGIYWACWSQLVSFRWYWAICSELGPLSTFGLQIEHLDCEWAGAARFLVFRDNVIYRNIYFMVGFLFVVNKIQGESRVVTILLPSLLSYLFRISI